MRQARIKIPPEDGPAGYHMFSRAVNKERLFGPEEKEMHGRMSQQVADGLGVELVTWQAMETHFHNLLRIPRKVPLTDEELIRRWHVLYPTPSKRKLRQFERIREQLPLNTPAAVQWRKQMNALMGDVSQYAKMLKERFSMWFNRKHKRVGPLWCGRFGSTLVELDAPAMRSQALYIDLNCVRARIVQDPKDYPYGGYGRAVAGNEAARRGIMRLLGVDSWEEAQREYRLALFTTGSELREKGASITQADLQRVLEQGGSLPMAEVLRCRVRYFSRGAVLGSKAFVEAQLVRLRERLGPRTRVRPLPAVTDWGDLAVLRQPRGFGLDCPFRERTIRG